MSVFKIGGSQFRPTGGVSGGREAEKKPEEKSAASKSGYDTVKFRDNRLAVMPRMSAVGGESSQRLRGETVETLLKASAPELDDYFSRAYGFDKDTE